MELPRIVAEPTAAASPSTTAPATLADTATALVTATPTTTEIETATPSDTSVNVPTAAASATGTATPLDTTQSRTITYTYGLGRQTGESARDLSGPISTTYNVPGQRPSLDDVTGTPGFTYDQLGRINQFAAPTTDNVGCGYDSAGQRTSLTYPGRHPDRLPLLRRRPEAVLQGTRRLAGYTYDAAGRLQTISRANGASTSYRYEGADRVTDLSTGNARGNVLSDFGYQHDKLGLVQSAAETLALGATTSSAPTVIVTLTPTSTATATLTATTATSATLTDSAGTSATTRDFATGAPSSNPHLPTATPGLTLTAFLAVAACSPAP